MAANEWINGYLEAILDGGAAAIEEQQNPTVDLRERGHFNPTKYFVEEVVAGVDETDLHRTWIKVVATRNASERSSRLENMCWRIWHLTRKKKQLEWEELQRLAKQKWERELVRKDATEDLVEDLSEGEKGDAVSELMSTETPRKTFQRNYSNLEVWSEDKKGKKLYIILISSIEALLYFFSVNQFTWVKYVVELSRALGKMPGVYRVDLFTRQVLSPEVDWSYGEPTEMLTTTGEDADGNDVGESSRAYIIRIPFGPRDKYLHKELLWPYIQEFVDGDSAELLSGTLNVPMVLTGHSLGRNKLEQLLKQGRQSKEDINPTYKIMRRIEAEEFSLDVAELVVTSTQQDIEEQWGLYDGFDVKLEKVLRVRSRRWVNCHGRYMPIMVVIPPGMDYSNVVIQEEAPEIDGEIVSVIGGTDGSSPRQFQQYGQKFLTNPHKPMILALSRPDPKKNITNLLKAFGECLPLRELANLTLIMGNWDDIDEMTGPSASVLVTVLKLVDKYDLYGQVAYPKHHKQADVPDIYRLAAKTKEDFINPALVEPFGLTLIEALNNGLLVDPHDQKAISSALLKLVAACRMRYPQWQTDTPGDDVSAEVSSLNDSLKDVIDMSLRLSVDGDKASLTGSLDPVALSSGDPELQDQVKRVLSKINKPEINLKETEGVKLENVASKYPILRRRRRLVVLTLDCYDSKGFPDKKIIQIIQDIFKAIRLDTQIVKFTGFSISTAMPVSETVEFLKSAKIQVNDFDALICGSGSEVYYPGTYTAEDRKLFADPDYASHVAFHWGYEGLKKTICKLMNPEGERNSPCVEEDVKSSNAHCVSYFVKDLCKAKKVDDLRQMLRMRGLRCHPMYCRNLTRIQVVPLLASRAQAFRYLFVRWRLNVANMFVIVGKTGDTDYEELIAGAHKTLIMKEVVTKGSEALLRTMDFRNDIVPSNSPLISSIKGGATPQEISEALKALSKANL
ncbi:putative sucrose-phosphate synthase 1 [Hibiscus syriacus]|uniref:sucrose-phosphate synthase n=1 Tax=Hibiscus syriacus TaxID=106335 RepID=A0A6A2XM77_HIBSY|nr:putative sucrose-phosphate synthase 1 [Hibiscus syriacus]